MVEEKGREPEDPMIKKVIELWNKYNDLKIISEKTGLSGEEAKKIIRLSRLPAGVEALVKGGKEIPIDKIDAKCDDKDNQELIEHIKEHGLLQAILVEEIDIVPSRYRILAGQRRYCAYVELNKQFPNDGYDKIPAIVKKEMGL